jgi:hypothetical protein
MFDSNDDWVETFRRSVYPRLHEPLSKVGDLVGVNLYAKGRMYRNQYVGTVYEDEDVIEQEFESLGAQRNAIACLKSFPDGRVSEGSWVILHDEQPELVPEGLQLHMTLFNPENGGHGREVYAHLEDDWRVSPLAHLRANNFSPEQGVETARPLLNDETFLELI